MAQYLIYPIGSTLACRYAAEYLQKHRFELVDHPTPEVTHLLLDVPGFGNDGLLRGGGAVERILETLPQYITVVGGNLQHPALEGYRKMDLLLDEGYLAENAAITADCALQTAAPLLTTTFAQSPALIIGWGRIGKCLAAMLKAIGCQVTVAARKASDRAMLQALGYRAADPKRLDGILPRFRILFNTVPTPVLNRRQLSVCRNCVKIDLASQKGLEGDDVIWARGLPGIHAPESSGQLIADTFIRLLKEEN